MSIASLRSRFARAFDLVGRVCPLLLLLVAALPAQAAVTSEITMVLSKVTGTVEVSTAANPDWQPASEGLTLQPEDQVRTGPEATARVSYPDAELRITPESTAILGYTSVRMQVGTLWVRMRKSGRTFEILTPTVAVTIRGTLVRAAAGPGGAIVHLLEGIVDVKSGDRKDTLNPHQQLEAPVGGAFTMSRIDPTTEVRLRSEFALGKGDAGRPAAPPPAPKKGGAGSTGGSGGATGSKGDGKNGGAGASGSDRSSSSTDFGQRALAAGLQNLERDLDARSTGMGISGGPESAFDGAAGQGSAITAGAAGTASSTSTGGASSSTAIRSLVSRPGGAAPLSTVGTTSVGGDVGEVGAVGGGGAVSGADDSGADLDGAGRGRGRGRGRSGERGNGRGR